MRVAIIYYSKTGRTKHVATYIKERLEENKIETDLFELKHVRDYFDKFLHFNPRLIYETLSKKIVKIHGIENFNPNLYDVIIIGSPIWFGTIVPAIRTFLHMFKEKINTPIICFTTSTLHSNYSLKFKKILESMEYNVIFHFTIVSLEEEKHIINEVISIVKKQFR